MQCSVQSISLSSTPANLIEAYRVAALISPGKDTGNPLALSNMVGGGVVQSAGGCNKGVSCASVARFSYALHSAVDCGKATVLKRYCLTRPCMRAAHAQSSLKSHVSCQAHEAWTEGSCRQTRSASRSVDGVISSRGPARGLDASEWRSRRQERFATVEHDKEPMLATSST